MKGKDKKIMFIEPQTRQESNAWLEEVIEHLMKLKKHESADLLPSEVEHLVGLTIAELEKEPIITELEAPLVISGDIHG
jgi:glutamate mutase epsilon subunit